MGYLDPIVADETSLERVNRLIQTFRYNDYIRHNFTIELIQSKFDKTEYWVMLSHKDFYKDSYCDYISVGIFPRNSNLSIFPKNSNLSGYNYDLLFDYGTSLRIDMKGLDYAELVNYIQTKTEEFLNA